MYSRHEDFVNLTLQGHSQPQHLQLDLHVDQVRRELALPRFRARKSLAQQRRQLLLVLDQLGHALQRRVVRAHEPVAFRRPPRVGAPGTGAASGGGVKRSTRLFRVCASASWRADAC